MEALNLYIKLFRPVAVLATSASDNGALIAKVAHRHPHLVRAIEPPDRDGAIVCQRAFAELVVGQRIAVPADAPWREVFLRQLCELPESQSKALVRAAMQFVAHAHCFSVPATTQRRAIAAGVIGHRVVTVDGQRGERPGLCSDGRPVAPPAGRA